MNRGWDGEVERIEEEWRKTIKARRRSDSDVVVLGYLTK